MGKEVDLVPTIHDSDFTSRVGSEKTRGEVVDEDGSSPRERLGFDVSKEVRGNREQVRLS